MYMLAIAQRERDQIDLDIAHHIRRRQQRRAGRGKRGRSAWTRGWVKRRREFGIYDQLMVELRREDPKAFKNFLRMPPEMFDEIFARIEHRLTKQHTWYREPLEPGLKLAVTLRHLASGAKYTVRNASEAASSSAQLIKGGLMTSSRRLGRYPGVPAGEDPVRRWYAPGEDTVRTVS